MTFSANLNNDEKINAESTAPFDDPGRNWGWLVLPALPHFFWGDGPSFSDPFPHYGL